VSGTKSTGLLLLLSRPGQESSRAGQYYFNPPTPKIVVPQQQRKKHAVALDKSTRSYDGSSTSSCAGRWVRADDCWLYDLQRGGGHRRPLLFCSFAYLERDSHGTAVLVPESRTIRGHQCLSAQLHPQSMEFIGNLSGVTSAVIDDPLNVADLLQRPTGTSLRINVPSLPTSARPNVKRL